MQRRATMTAILGAAACMAAVASTATAQDLCSKPIQPICSTDLQTTGTDAERLRCTEDARRYEETMIEYRDCLKNALDGAEADLRKAQGLMSCLKEGGDNCEMQATN